MYRKGQPDFSLRGCAESGPQTPTKIGSSLISLTGRRGVKCASGRNTSRFDNIMLQPRVMAHVETRTIGTRFLGRKYGLPFGIAPMGSDLALCRVRGLGTVKQAVCDFEFPVYVLSARLRHRLRRCESARENSWFQLYVMVDTGFGS